MQAKSIKGNSPEEIKCSHDKSFNANYKTDLDTTLHKINVVPQDIGRVVLNLINNAFYACTERASAGSATGASAGSDHTSPADSPGIPY